MDLISLQLLFYTKNTVRQCKVSWLLTKNLYIFTRFILTVKLMHCKLILLQAVCAVWYNGRHCEIVCRLCKDYEFNNILGNFLKLCVKTP
jgi:hypothetical protein